MVNDFNLDRNSSLEYGINYDFKITNCWFYRNDFFFLYKIWNQWLCYDFMIIGDQLLFLLSFLFIIYVKK